KPHPPIWMAAVSESSFEVAGRLGHNLLCSLVPGFKNEQAARFLETYRKALHAGGQDTRAKQIGALCMVYCAETTAQARQDFGAAVLWYYQMMAKYVAPPGAESPAPGYEDYARTRYFARTVKWDELLESGALVCGNPDLCVAQIEEMR